MSTLSTHVLDAAYGAPASGMSVSIADGAGADLASATTDGDGRIRFDLDLDEGPYLLTYETGVWFGTQGRDTFFPAVGIVFDVGPGDEHYHVALLLSPYSYTTYRGS